MTAYFLMPKIYRDPSEQITI